MYSISCEMPWESVSDSGSPENRSLAGNGNRYRLNSIESLYPAVQIIVVWLGMGNGYRVHCTGSLYPAVRKIVVWLGMDNGYRVSCEMHWVSVSGRGTWSGWEKGNGYHVKCTGGLYPAVQRIDLRLGMGNGYRMECTGK